MDQIQYANMCTTTYMALSSFVHTTYEEHMPNCKLAICKHNPIARHCIQLTHSI